MICQFMEAIIVVRARRVVCYGPSAISLYSVSTIE